MYLFFTDKDQKMLPSQFFYTPGMQNLSKKEAVFVLVKVDKKPTDDQKELLKKYRVTKLDTAVLSDHEGNPLAHAEEKSSSILFKQIKKARALIEKIDKDVSERMEKAKAAYEKGDRNGARVQYQAVIRKYPTYDEATDAAGYVSNIEEEIKKEKEKEAAKKMEQKQAKAEENA
jgi:cell division protein FtsI/penicillin-binding protein 2